MKNECLIPILPIRHTEDYFLSKLYLTNKPANETMRILKTLTRYVKICNRDIFYTIEIFNNGTLRHKPLSDLADDILITVSIFSKHIQKLHKRGAAPSIQWYIQVGSTSFQQLGYPDIANAYGYWTCFIQEHIFA